MSDHRLRGELPKHATRRQLDVLAAYIEAGGSVSSAAARAGVWPSTAKRHLGDLRARTGLTTEQLTRVRRRITDLVPVSRRSSPVVTGRPNPIRDLRWTIQAVRHFCD